MKLTIRTQTEQAELTVLEGDAVSEKNPHYLELDVTEPGGAGARLREEKRTI